MSKHRNRSQRTNELSRRDLMRASALGLLGAGVGSASWMPALADSLAADSRANGKRHCVLLWMTGGPTQTDTFDMKPNHANGGQFKEIQTSAAGLRFSEHLPKLAKMADQLAVVRSLSTAEGDHSRGTYLMRTGHRPGGPIHYPTLGSSLSKHLGSEDAELPNFISIAPYRAFNRSAFLPGFLGPRYAALTVGATNTFQRTPAQNNGSYAALGVDDLHAPAGVTESQVAARLELLRTLQQNFVANHQTDAAFAHKTVNERAVRMMKSDAAKAFELSEESDKVRDAYGKTRFGQGCLMARRLIEKGVPFIEVTLAQRTTGAFGWDTHRNNFARVKELSTILDAGWSSLMSDLKDRGLLESTTIIWMGEFGRTPKINRGGGRDHYPKAWSGVLAGGGLKGGQAYGSTGKDGIAVTDGKANVGDFLATLCAALQIDPKTQNISEMGRPIRIAEGKPIKKILS
ncbi:MAG: DUF1501 domain-containing protein [Planctomycetes bacterium]|nr:DUF1501 domain-containing protein [Planctomycetota bacterium]